MAKSFVTILWDPVSFSCNVCLISRPVSVLTVRVNPPSHFSFLLCRCSMDSKMQTMSNGYSMKRTTAVQLSVPLITIDCPNPGCRSSFQWPVLSSHLKINTVPFPRLSASCRPSSISSKYFSLADPLCSAFYIRFLLVSPPTPSDFSAHIPSPCTIILYLIWALLTVSLELSISFRSNILIQVGFTCLTSKLVCETENWESHS